MEHTALSIIWIILAYLLGSLPVGVLLARLKGQDPRKAGSGNIGATNVMRTSGKVLGITTLIGDALKGFLPVWLAMHFGLTELIVAAIGLAAFVGHLYPAYLRFKGGKGVATAVGVFLAFNPLAVAFDVAVFILVLDRWRYVSLGSLIGTALMPILLLFFQSPLAYVALSLIMAILIFIKHEPNITRLRAGTEHKIGKGNPTRAAKRAAKAKKG
jgi:acyl phosphate:glycerol-3-phosphate acyltransferase